MGNQNKSKLIDKSSNSVWFLLWGSAGTTLFLKTDFFDPFNSAKLIFLLITSAWLIGHLVNCYRENPISIKSKESVPTFLVLGFIIFLFASTLMTDRIIVALLGETQRRNGFLGYLGLSVIFLFASRKINFLNALRVYKVAIITGLILGTYGLIQITGKDFIKWNNPYNSMIGTLGNPNFASATLAILFLLAIYALILKNVSKIYKFLAIIFLLVAMIDIIVSGSRQGLLTIFFSVIFYISTLTYFKYKKIGKLVLAFSLTSAVMATLGMLQIGPFASLLYKDSVSVRGYYWRAGIEMFKHSPLTGIGVDRYGAFFKEFREVGYPLKYGFEITSSNAHNTFIQLFATSGVFVGAVYLLLMGYVFYTGINLVRKSNEQERLISLGLLSAWVGFQAQSLISIDNLGISVWGWLLGGSLVGLSRKKQAGIGESLDKNYNSKVTNRVQINLFQPVISALILVPTLFFSSVINNFEKNLYFASAIAVPSIPQNKNKVAEYSKILLNSYFVDPTYEYRSAVLLSNMGDKEKAFEIMSNLQKEDPRNLDYLLGLVYFEELRGNISGVIILREKISKADPWNAENYFQLLTLYKTAGDLLKAGEMKEKILSFAPNSELAKTASEMLG